MQNPTFTILLKATGKRIDGLQVDDVHQPEEAEASVVFLTAARKRWKLKLSEFSFVFPATKP